MPRFSRLLGFLARRKHGQGEGPRGHNALTSRLRGCVVLVIVTITLICCPSRCRSEGCARLGPWAGDLDVGPRMMAKSIILRGSIFFECHLQGAVFDGSDLSAVHFTSCDLEGVSFRGACLANVVVEDCDGGDQRSQRFVNVDFTNADIQGIRLDCFARLSAVQLMSTRSYRKKDLRECVLMVTKQADGVGPSPYDFRGANLKGAWLNGDFTGADLSDATIDDAGFEAGAIRFRQLIVTRNYRERKMRNMVLRLEGDHCDFTSIDMTGSTVQIPSGTLILKDAIIAGCDFSGTDVGSQLSSTASYRGGEIIDVGMGVSDLGGLDLSGQNLSRCSFSSCNLVGTKLEDAVITGARFKTIRGHDSGITVEQIKSTWNYKQGRMEGISLPRAIADALTNERTAGKAGADGRPPR